MKTGEPVPAVGLDTKHDRATEFEAVFRWLQPRLVGYLSREVSHDIAAGLAGDTLYAIWRKDADVGKCVGDPQLAGLAFRIADGLLRNSHRSERRMRSLISRLRWHSLVDDSDTNVADSVEASDQAVALLRALSPADRELVGLLLAGVGADEIAVFLGVAPGTARMRLSRLRERIARGPTEGGGDDQ